MSSPNAPSTLGQTHEPVYTLADLKRWPHVGPALAVIGHPIAHSLSPAMHNAALAALAKEDKKFQHWHYYKFDIPPETLSEALAQFHTKGFLGLNLTLPHKVHALDCLAGVEPLAHHIGAVNTLKHQEEGYYGYNTDSYGLERALLEELDVRLAKTDVILLGAGGAARAAAVHCLQAGCRELWISNRSRERLTALLAALQPFAGKIKTTGFSLNNPPDRLPQHGLLINATSLGLQPDDPVPFNLEQGAKTYAVFDMVYGPAPTALVATARRRGLPAANGLAMLVWQGARALELWTNRAAPIDAMSKAARLALNTS